MDYIEVYRVPISARLEEFWQAVFSKDLPDMLPRKTPVDVARADFEEQRVVFVIGVDPEFLIQKARRGLLSNRRCSCCEDF